MQIFKRILFVILLLNILPIFCILVEVCYNNIDWYNFILVYLAGWFLNLIMSFLIVLTYLGYWCFNKINLHN